MYGNSRKIVGIWEGSDKEYTLPTLTPKVGDALVVKFDYPVSSIYLATIIIPLPFFKTSYLKQSDLKFDLMA